ncbi:MAG: aldo/keto reductase [Cohaesibacteraceae bacterium]
MTETRLTFSDGHTMPQLGFGLWEVPAAETARVVREGLEAGYRLVDGAAIYGNEEGMGEGLRSANTAREDVFATSKVWNSEQGYDSTLRAVDASLQRIGLDYLNLCLVHWPAPNAGLYVDTWKALVQAKADGKVRSIGVSNFMSDHLERIIGETGVTPVLNQIELHPHLQQEELRTFHAEHTIVTQSWTPLGKGRSFDAEPIQQAAARTGKSPAQIVIRWHIELGCSVIPRSTKTARLAENRDVFDFELTTDEHTAIAGLNANSRTGPDPMAFG